MKIKVAIALVIVMVIVAFITSKLFSFQIHKDHRGIVYNTLTGELDKENILEPGTTTKLPWKEIYTIYVGGNSFDAEFDVLDKNANSLNISISCRFAPIPDKVGHLFYEVAEDYKERVLIPEVRSITRTIMSNYSAGDIYNYERQQIERTIISQTGELYKNYHVTLQSLLIRSVKLSPELRQTLEEEHKKRVTDNAQN